MTTRGVRLEAGRIGLHGVTGDDAVDILDTVEVPIVVVRRNFIIVSFNQAAADVLGLSPSDIGRSPRDIPALAGLPRLEERCVEVIAGRMESRADFRHGGKWFVVRISAYPKGDRHATGTVLTFTNVTAFRASIDQAIYERECTKAIINTVADPLVVLSADQQIQSGNRAFYTMFGVSRDETQGVPLYELGAFELAALRTRLDEMLAGSHAFQPFEVDHVVTGKGQRTLMLDARPLSLPGHAERRVLVTFQDITTRKQAELAKDLRSEEELRRSEAFLAEGHRLSLTGSFSWRVATDEITWSDQLYRIFEFDQGMPVTLELIGARVHPEDIPLFSDMVGRARSARADFDYEYRLLMPDHSVRYVHVIAHGTRDRDGGLEYIGAAQDVTHRRLSEEALAKARAELAHVARVTSLGTLTASIAHEVSQPLSGIITNANTCLRMLASEPPNVDGAGEAARRTIRDGNRASEVITRLRALFARKTPTPERLDLNKTTQEVIALLRGELQRNRAVMRLELAENLPIVMGDRIQLQQVIMNLLRNAAEAMRGVDDRPREIVVRTSRDDEGGRVCLSVQDSGVGFGPQGLEKVFDAFYTTKQDGMGIGLSVSRSIIEGHHGHLWVTLNDGPGVTFSFAIPVDCVASKRAGDGAPNEHAATS